MWRGVLGRTGYGDGSVGGWLVNSLVGALKVWVCVMWNGVDGRETDICCSEHPLALGAELDRDSREPGLCCCVLAWFGHLSLAVYLSASLLSDSGGCPLVLV